MQKIPTVFVRDEQDRRFVTDDITPGCEWVFTDRGVRGERKYDGTCVMLDEHGKWWARREIKPGQVEPPYFVEVGRDGVTGKTMGWIPIGYSTWSRWHAEALVNVEKAAGLAPEDPPTIEPGTYELVGPRINGNPERYEEHWLVQHAGAELAISPPYTNDGVRRQVAKLAAECGYEGVVFKHPDGQRMAKLKAKDLRP
jgi:hypothetical protein